MGNRKAEERIRELEQELEALRARHDVLRARHDVLRDRHDALAVDAARWQRLLDESPVGIAVYAPDGTLKLDNEHMRELFGVTRAEAEALRGRYNLLEDEQHVRSGVMELLRKGFGGEPVSLPPICYDPRPGLENGHEPVWVQCSLQPIRDERGEVQELILVFVDISGLKRTELALRESEERFRELADHIRDVFWLFDWQKKKIIYRSAEYETTWGRPADAIEDGYESWRQAIHPDDRDRVEAFLIEAVEKGHGRRREYRILRPDGEVRWIADRAFPIRDEEGKVVRVAGIAEDVTEQRDAAEALRQTRDRLETLITHTPVLVWALDADGRITLSEGRGLEALGLRPGELVGRSVFDLYSDSPAIRGHAERALAGEAVEGVSREGDRVFEFRYVPQFDDDGHPAGAFGVAMDVTDRKQAEDERRLLEAKMQQAQKLESLGVLAGGIAHDFNNLLMGMLGHANLARQVMPPESPSRPHLEQVETAALRAAELTNQMLAYSGKGRFVVEILELNRLVEEMGHLLRTVISKKAELRLELAPDLPAIEADASQLRQIVMNLITNASEALQDQKGVIVVRTEERPTLRPHEAREYFESEPEDEAYVALIVTDTGCGMDESTRAKIFDPFYTTKFTGRGLGLAAVLGIVRGHRGAIHVRSSTGQGTAFEVLLPAFTESEEAPAEGRSDATPANRGTTILVVDDDEMVRNVAAEMLKADGYPVLTACDGYEAVDIFRTHESEIGLVLLDMTMPRLSGKEAYEALCAIRKDVRVVISSGYDHADAERRFEGHELAGFIQKPYRSSDLLAAVRRALAEDLPAS